MGETPSTPGAHRRIETHSAIVHDWFQGFHGSERVVDALRTELFRPGDPDILTFHAARDLLPADLAAAIVKESTLAGLPGVRQRGHDPGRWRYLLPYMPHYFARLPLDEYGFVLSSSHACALGVRRAPDAVHVCYCHTPMRYAWLPETESDRVSGIQALALRSLRGYLRRADTSASRRPDHFVANSVAVRDRIRRFYGRDATVVHPPVDTDQFDHRKPREEGRFLWVHRLVSYKEPLAVAEAFRGLPFRLTMVGVGPLSDRLRRTKPPNVELLDWLPRDELVRRFESASGFIHVAEEDFGISVVEALAAGAPVLALDRGGARDIVRPGTDGQLVPDARPETIRAALDAISASSWNVDELRARAESFSRRVFAGRMLDVIRGQGVR